MLPNLELGKLRGTHRCKNGTPNTDHVTDNCLKRYISLSTRSISFRSITNFLNFLEFSQGHLFPDAHATYMQKSPLYAFKVVCLS